MKAKKVLCGVVVSVFLLCVLSMSVMGVMVTRGTTFVHTFSSRGNSSSASGPQSITGKVCRMATNFIKVYVDANTPARSVQYKIQYWISLGAGAATKVDEETIWSNFLGNSANHIINQSWNIGTQSLVYAGYTSLDRAFVRGVASGATTAYYFEIRNAVFVFTN